MVEDSPHDLEPSSTTGPTRRQLLGNGGLALLVTASVAACDLSTGAKPPTDGNGGGPAGGKGVQAPGLASDVGKGDLPVLAKRLPKSPVVVRPTDRVGSYGGTWRSVISGAADTPWLAKTVGYEQLLRWTPDWSKMVPNIAESVEQSADARQFTIRLRAGMRWSDGEPFTADDLAFVWDDVLRNADINPVPPPLALSGKGDPGTLTKVDDRTVRITFPTPSGFFVPYLPWNAAVLVESPRHYLKDFHKKYNPDVEKQAKKEGFSHWTDLFAAKADVWNNTDLPSLHPWTLRVGLGSGRQVVVERNPYYFKTDPDGSQLPYLDKVVFEVISDPEVMLLKATNGELDYHARHFNTLRNKPVLGRSRSAGDYHFVDMVPDISNIMILGLNFTHENPVKRQIFTNKDFRIGLSYAINRKEVITTVLQGQSEPWQVAPRRSSSLFDEQMAKQYTEYDVDLANRHLDRAGYSRRGAVRLGPDGKPITFTVLVPTGTQEAWTDILELLTTYWRRVGIGVHVNPLERTLWSERTAANKHDAAVWQSDGGQDWEALLRPWAYLPLYASYSFWGQLWVSWYTSGGKEGERPPAWIRRQLALYDQIKGTASHDDQIALMKQILAIDKEQFHVLGIARYPDDYGICRNDFHNVPARMPESGGVYLSPAATNPEQYFTTRQG